MRYLRKHHKEDQIFKNELVNALPFYEEFNKTIKNLWSSISVKEYI